MPRSYLIIGLKNIHVKRIEESKSGELLVYGKYKGRKKCSRCDSSRVHSRGWVHRRLKHCRVGNRIVEIDLELRKLSCLKCHRVTRQRMENILPRRRATETYRQEVFEQHVAGITQKHLSRTHKVSGSTVERWLWDFLWNRVKELSGRKCPKVLGIDEHFFTRKKGYATSLIDLKNHRVFDVVLGRSELSLEGYFKQLKGREGVQVVVMDLSETYRSLVKKYFPKAMIVSDRFHVVRIVQQYFQKLWATVDPIGRKHRGLLSLFRQHRGKMRPESLAKLERYFEKNPSMRVFDEVQQKLLAFMRIKHVTHSYAKRLIPEFLRLIEDIKESGVELLVSLAKTIESWIEPIVRMWRFTKTNSITEGFHCKMEMITRRAFGFRNFQNYRIRVLALCGWDGLFTRIDL